MGAGGATKLSASESERSTVVFRVSEGQRRGVSPFRRVAAFRRSWCCGASNEKGRDEKRRALRGTIGFPYRKEGRDRLAWPGPWKLRRAGSYWPGCFHIGNLMIKGEVVLLKENL